MWNDLEGIALLGSGQTSFIILTSFWFLNVLFAHLPLKAVSGLSKIQVTTCLYKYSWDSLGDFILFSIFVAFLTILALAAVVVLTLSIRNSAGNSLNAVSITINHLFKQFEFLKDFMNYQLKQNWKLQHSFKLLLGAYGQEKT